jgi:RNA polymerase sigma-70 factor, ECF subfamily
MPDRRGPAGAPIADGDLVRLARAGDEVAFRLLVERHQPMARARARSLSRSPGDADDIVQESFLRAFTALDRLRDPDRFAGWLGGIVANVCRGLQRRAPLTLVADWPEHLHPASAGGLPSADDMDRADALRAAVAGLPAGQQRAVALYYYADLPASQITEQAGAARASLHKARERLRAYITQHRPDLVPVASRRIPMTTVRIASAEHIPQSSRRSRGRLPGRAPTHLVVLADDAGGRELRLWMQPFDGRSLEGLLERAEGTASAGAVSPLADTADELTGQLLDAVGASVAAVDISELGPEVAAARIELAGPAGTRHVTARLSEGLALAITTSAPVRVADAVLDRLAVPSGEAEQPGSAPGPGRGSGAAARSVGTARPRYEPRNLAFTNGLDEWYFFGSFAEHAAASHWHDYAVGADHGIAVLRSTVPRPEGFAVLAQAVFADDYHSATVTFRGEFRVSASRGRAGLGLRVNEGHPIRGPLTEESVLADPDNNIVTIPGGRDWTRHEITARVPEDSEVIAFAIFLAGPGQIELRNPELVRT